VSRPKGEIVRLIDRLKAFYGALPTPPSDPFQLFVWEMLSVHTVPPKRDAAMAALKRNRALTPDAMWKAAQKKLEDSVRLAGPYLEQRLATLRTGVAIFRRTPDLPKILRGPLPAARRALKDLPRMGEGNAYRLLLFAGNHCVLPVDARVSRVACRLGYGEKQSTFSRTARSVRDAVAADLPETLDAYRRAYIYFDHHGAATCTETDPHCHVCPLLQDCLEGKKRDVR
jgi:endonuclease III